MEENPSRLLAGRIILSGMVSLFVGLALIVIGMFLSQRMSMTAAGNGFLGVGKLFTVLWLPLVAFGALMRVINPAEPKEPTPRRPRSASQAIDTHLETRWGGGPANPTREELQAALKELDTVDEEHPNAWLTDSDGRTVDVYEGGLVIFAEEDETLCERRAVTREQALELWLLLQQGKRDEIIARMKS